MESDINSSFPWIDYLLSYFKNLKQIDDEIEKIRVSLCEISQFSPLSLFEYLDIDSKSFLTLNDFKSFLRSQNSTYDERKLRKMIHNFDKDNDFSINLDEFLGLILPRKSIDLHKNMVSIINTCNSNKNNINHEMELNLNNLILREIQLIEELDEISAKIKNSKLFSTYEAFLAIVRDEKYMTKLNLYNFLKKNGVYINDAEVSQLMFRLDSDNDDRISYEEFKEMFYPIKEDYVYSNKDNNYISNYINKYETNNKYNYNDNNLINTKKDNDYNDYNYNDDNYDNKDNYNNSNNINNGKKGKKTKKVILKIGKNNNNSNIFHSQDSNNNFLRQRNNQQESYSKFPNINNNNSTDNYTLNNRTSKCKICTFSKNDNYNNKEPSFNEINNETNNNKSEISQYNLISSKRNNIPINKYNYSNNYDNNNNERKRSYESRYTLKTRNKSYFSPNNNYNNDIEDNNETINCRGCLYTAKNFHNNYKHNNNNNNNSTYKYTTTFNNHINNNNRLKNKNDLNNNNNQINNIYKRKEELLKKYGIYNNDNNDNNDIFNSEENIYNRCFSSLKTGLFDDNNNFNKNDNYNEKNKTPQLNICKTIATEKRYKSNNSNFSTAFNSKNNKNNENNSKAIFTERYQGIKDNDKISFSNCKYKNVNIKGNNISERKKLFYQLLVNYIEQGNNLETIKKGEKSIEEIKNMISVVSDNIFYDLFGEIKKENKPGIQRDDIDKFMKGNGYNIKDYEIEIIMGKMDKNKDGIIDYEEFISEVQPKHI